MQHSGSNTTRLNNLARIDIFWGVLLLIVASAAAVCN
jgi:hypothetical protein